METPATPSHVRDEPYEGAREADIAVGKSKVYGWVTALIGAAVGGIIAATTNRTAGPYTERAQKLMKTVDWNVDGKNAIIAGSALLGGLIGNYTGMAIGFVRGLRNAGDGRAQFNRIKAERNMLAQQLDEVEAQNDQLHEELGKRSHLPEYLKYGSHTEAAVAKKEAEQTTEIAR